MILDITVRLVISLVAGRFIRSVINSPHQEGRPFNIVDHRCVPTFYHLMLGYQILGTQSCLHHPTKNLI